MDQIDIDQPISTGTTIMAIVYDGGVLIGADSRTSSGAVVVDRFADKIDYLHERIFCLRTGSAADTQYVAKVVRYYLSMHSIELGEFPQVKTAATLARKFLYEYKDYLSAAMIIGGWDKQNGPQLYEIPLGGTVIPTKIALSGSGSSYIYGYVDANYRENFTFAEARQFVLNSVNLAHSRDGYSGGYVRLLNITKDGYSREVVEPKDQPFKI